MLAAAFPIEILIIVAICAVLSSVGYIKFVYFLSVGYGFAIAGSGLAMIIMHFCGYSFFAEMSIPVFILCLLFIVYGVRLSGFLLYREFKSMSYRKNLNNVTKTDKPMPFFVKVIIWVSVVALYTMQVSPVFYRLENHHAGNDNIVLPIIGACIMVVAIIIESLADHQKSEAKKVNPKRFCDKGLYKIVRCPNYFGEVLFWTGVFISGCNALYGWAQWLMAILGYLLLVYVMLSGAKRLEKRQNKNYGEDIEYQQYVKKTPIIFPLIPLKSLQKAKFIK